MNPPIDEFCRQSECRMYFEHELFDEPFEPTTTLSSCYIIGHSHDIRVIPENCFYRKEATEFQLWMKLRT